MSEKMIEASNVGPLIPEKRMSYMVGNNDGVSHIADSLGIRKESLDQLGLGNSGAIRFGDIFNLSVDTDGRGILTKTRNGVRLGGKPTETKFELPKEAIYQNIEKDTSGLGISYVRIPSSNKYQILASDQSLATEKPYFVAAKNLDAFRQELLQISGKLMAECNSRKEQYELACLVQGNKNFPGVVDVNSTRLFDWMPTSIDMKRIVKLIDTKEEPNPVEFGKFLATFATQSATH